MLKSIKNVLAAAAFLGMAVTSANAAPITLKASITGITGNAALLAELGITDGTAMAFATFDADVSSGATLIDNDSYKYDYLSSTYTSFSLVAPSKTIDAVASDGSTHRVFTGDGILDGTANIFDQFEIVSSPNSTDANSYDELRFYLFDYDETIWSRVDPISASLLNSFAGHYFTFSKYLSGVSSLETISSSSITWSEVSQVPIPAALPLLGGALSLLGFFGWRRKRAAAA